VRRVNHGQNAPLIPTPLRMQTWQHLSTVKTLTTQRGLKVKRRRSNGRAKEMARPAMGKDWF